MHLHLVECTRSSSFGTLVAERGIPIFAKDRFLRTADKSPEEAREKESGQDA